MQKAAPQSPEVERAGPQPPSLERSWRRGLGWVFPMPRGECPPVIYTDIYRKHTGLLIHKIEEQSVFSLAGLSGSVADLNHFRTCPDLPAGRRPTAWELAANGAAQVQASCPMQDWSCTELIARFASQSWGNWSSPQMLCSLELPNW